MKPLQFNTAVAQMMTFLNVIIEKETNFKSRFSFVYSSVSTLCTFRNRRIMESIDKPIFYSHTSNCDV